MADDFEPVPNTDAASGGPKRPFWKSPFFLGFLVGAALLTVLPLLQRKVLRAPPPIRALPAFQLAAADGHPVSSSDLKGKVWLASLASGACGAPCLERQRAFATVPRHVEDLGGKVVLVTLLLPSGDEAALRAFAREHESPQWLFLSGTPDALRPLLDALREGYAASGEQAATSEALAASPVFALVDQDNALRGFWKDDDLSRGNLVNAARLLARYGPNP